MTASWERPSHMGGPNLLSIKLGAAITHGWAEPVVNVSVYGIIPNHWFMETAQPHTASLSELCISLLNESGDI